MFGAGFKELINTYFGKFLIVLSVTVFMTKSGLWFAVPPYFITPLWLVTGASMGLCLLLGFRYLPAIMVGLLIGFYFHNYSAIELFIPPIQITLFLSTFTFIIILIKALIFKWIFNNKSIFKNIGTLLLMFGVFTLLSLIAFIAFLTFSNFYKLIPANIVNNVLITWTGADLAGTILFAPFILSIADFDKSKCKKISLFEYAIVAGFLLLLTMIILSYDVFKSNIYFLIIIPFLLFASIRYQSLSVLSLLCIVFYLECINITLNIADIEPAQYFTAVNFLQALIILIVPCSLIFNMLFYQLRIRNFLLNQGNFNLLKGIEGLKKSQGEQLNELNKVNIDLLESETRFKNLIQPAEDGILVHANGLVVDVNNAFLSVSGYKREEIIGKSLALFFVADLTPIGSIIHGDIAIADDFLLKCKKSNLVHVELRNRLAEDQGEKIQVVSVRNITTQVEASKTVSILKTAIEQSPSTILITDSEGKIEYANHAFTNITGYSVEEVIGKRPNILKSGFHSEKFYKDLWDKILKGEIWKGEFLNIKKDGTEYWEAATIAPVLKNNKIIHFICTKEDITEHKKNRESILESERKYRLLAENVADVIWVSDSHLKYTYISPSVEILTGYSNDELKSMLPQNYLPKVPRELLADLARIRKSKKEDVQDTQKKWETSIQTKNGSIIWFETRIQPIFSVTGQFNGIIGVSRDITQRKQSETALKESEEKFRSFFENNNVIILVIDPVTARIESANNSAIRYYGYSIEEFSAIRFNEICNEPFEVLLEYFKNIQSGKEQMITFSNKLKDGRIKEVEIYPTPIQIGNRVLLYTIIQDISKRKKAISALKESESKKLALLKIIPDLIYIINRAGILLDVYTDKPSKLAFPPEQMVGHSFINLLPGELRTKFKQLIEEVFNNKVIRSMEYSFHRDDKEIFEEARLIMSSDDELLIIIRDMNDLKLNEQELKRAWEEAERANNAKTNFLANISHEIRTPINSIIGFTELMDYELTDKNLKNYLASIKSSSKTLLSLIEDLLDLSKIEAGELSLKPEPVSIRSVFNEIYQVFWLKMKEKNLNFDIKIPERLPDTLIMDELRIRQILMNLLSNALKFTENGNIVVVVSVDETNSIPNYPSIDLIIEVCDTGIGIPKEYQSLIFEAFKQQDEQDSRKYGGTGLGLAITRRLVEMMHGTIKLDSQPGKGSRFSVYLPAIKVRKGKSIAKEIESDELLDIVFHEAKILIVDDILTNRILLKNCIRGNNLTFYEASNGEEAIDIVKRYLPDIVLLDLNLPIINGFAVAEYIKTNIKEKEIHIIAISATRLSEKEAIYKKFFDVFIAKPFKTKEITHNMMKFMEYSRVDEGIENTKVTVSVNDILEFNGNNKMSLLNELEIILQQYTITIESSSFEEIKRYALNLRNIGNDYNIKLFMQKGEEIMESAENFDIEAISKSLLEIPEIIHKIQTEIQK
jgi:PAS domain S-box-containing protein